jgi:AcrR family transcriptional regulator
MADNDLPRSRNAERTRAAILGAAQDAFATRGYSATGVREITAAAGVSIALVNRYYGSKEKLFEAALADLLNASLLTNVPRAEFGAAAVDILLGGMPAGRNPVQMMLLASADPTARSICVMLLEELVFVPLARWFGEEGRAKAAQFVALASGITLYREVYPLEPFAGDVDSRVRKWMIDTLQALAA